MRDQSAVRADHDMGPDDAIGTDRGALADHGAVFNPRRGIDRIHVKVFANIAVDVFEFCGGYRDIPGLSSDVWLRRVSDLSGSKKIARPPRS
jgi:hypothetical protein